MQRLGRRHAVGSSDYGAIRAATFMDYHIFAELAGIAVSAAGPGRVTVANPLWSGYLANLSPSVWA